MRVGIAHGARQTGEAVAVEASIARTVVVIADSAARIEAVRVALDARLGVCATARETRWRGITQAASQCAELAVACEAWWDSARKVECAHCVCRWRLCRFSGAGQGSPSVTEKLPAGHGEHVVPDP